MFVHVISLLGKRQTNEDQHLVFLNINGANQKYANVNLFCVFDGHGGGGVSLYLKKKLYPLILDKKTTYPISDEKIKKIYDYLQKGIMEEFKNNCEYMGSTCLVIINYKKDNNEYLQIFNTGDCRAFINNNYLAVELSKDHKPHKFEEKIRIEALGGEIKFDGVDWRIEGVSVSRAFGDTKANPYITHNCEVQNYQFNGNEKFFVLACDGLWDVLSSNDVNDFILSNMYIDPNTKTLMCIDKRKNIAKLLGEYAIKKGSLDNISIIIAFI
jgi:protein phosphatase 1L